MLGAHLSGRMWSEHCGQFPSLHRTEQGLSEYKKGKAVILQTMAALLWAFMFAIRELFSSAICTVL